MADRNDSRNRGNTVVPIILVTMCEELQEELARLHADANNTRGSFDEDTPAAHRLLNHDCPTGRKCYAFAETYIKPRDRFTPLRCSDAELDPARNHVEELMLGFLDGECDCCGNDIDERDIFTRPIVDPRFSWEKRSAKKGRKGKPTDGSPLWRYFDATTMEVAWYADGQPQFRDRKSKQLIRDPRALRKPRRGKNRNLSISRPKPPSRALTASPKQVAQVVPLAPQLKAPSSPITWDHVHLDDVIPE